jgi:hypothetical protein
VLAFVGLLSGRSSTCCRAAQTALDFDKPDGMHYWPGAPVPENSGLSREHPSYHGALFASAGGPYVSVVRLVSRHATSGINGIGSVSSEGRLIYDSFCPVHAFSFDPSDPSIPGTTDFASVRADHWADSGEEYRAWHSDRNRLAREEKQ